MKIAYSNIDLEFIGSLIRQAASETSTLIFKSILDFPVIEKDIYRLATDIAAFANSGGGSIIFGIEKNKQKAAAFSKKTDIKTDTHQLRRTILNLLPGKQEIFEIKKIENNNPDLSELILLEINVSHISPALAPDYRFYKRTGKKNVLMEQSEINIAFDRTKKPELEITGIGNTGGIPQLKNGKIESIYFLPKIIVKNISSVIEKHYKLEVHIPTSLCDEEYYAQNSFFSRHEGEYTVFSIPGREVLFQNEIKVFSDTKISVFPERFIDFENLLLKLTLFFSTGVKTTEFRLVDTFLYNHNSLSKNDFI